MVPPESSTSGVRPASLAICDALRQAGVVEAGIKWPNDVLAGGKKIAGILTELAAEPDRVFTNVELLRDVWGFQAQARTRTLDSHASRVRRKLAHGGHEAVCEYIEVGHSGANRRRPTAGERVKHKRGADMHQRAVIGLLELEERSVERR